MTWHWKNRHGWIRALGIGIRLRETRLHPPTFSEQFAGAWFVDVGRWRVSSLPQFDSVTYLPRRKHGR